METNNFVEKSHKVISLFLAVLIFLSAAFYTVLLISDSPTYRLFVYFQIGLLLLLSVFLWLSQSPSFSKLLWVWGLACIATYINGVYLNYGNGLLLWVAPAIVLIAYSASSIFVFKRQII
jgi:hypothetical protein